MNQSLDTISVSIPRAIVGQLRIMADDLTDRMHNLLERNTDGALSPAERRELETLVYMAQFAQVLAMVTNEPDRP